MSLALLVGRWLSIVGFLFFGIVCLTSPWAKAEFERFGVAQFRVVTGLLEIAGALGLAIGFFVPRLVVFSSAGLALLMLFAVIIRLRIADPILAMLPAIALLVINAFIFLQARRG